MSDNGQPRYTTEFIRTGVSADPAVAAQLRQEFAAWLRHQFILDETRASDVVLAVNEALANAAEFAYVTADRPGAMHLCAEYDATTRVLAVVVRDDGVWRLTAPGARPHSRGRGIPLMEALADRVTIDTNAKGTQVAMEWDQVAALDQAPQAHEFGSRTT
jgi:serine/threonine-protein kinase RsbW